MDVGSKPIPSLERQNVRFIHLAELPRDLRNLPFLVLAPLKVTLQILAILYALWIALPHPPEYIMVQVGFLSAIYMNSFTD